MRANPAAARAVAATASGPAAVAEELAVDRLTVRRAGRTTIDSMTLGLRPGEFTAICGPNGAGKSTLLGVLAGSLKPSQGGARLDGRALSTWSSAELARRRAVLSQQPVLQFPFRVAEVVALGRLPHQGRARAADDARIVRAAMARVEIDGLADRSYLALSGGERQRVQVARALAQVWEAPPSGARWLLLDEPTGSLDLRHQLSLMKTLGALAREGWAVVAVLHDLPLVARWADRCLLVCDGRLAADGPPVDVLNAARIGQAYGLDADEADRFARSIG